MPPVEDVGELPGLQPGAAVGRYVVEHELGAGAMGIVYAAMDPELDREVALKVVRPRVNRRHGSERLVQEARALASVNHPNVVTIHDVGTAGSGDVFIAMELLHGQTVATWVRETTRAESEVRAVFAAAARGLEAAHHAGLVHRDFKPENMMLEESGRVVVLDFGLAHAAAPGDSQPPLAARVVVGADSAPHTAGVVGTPAYMAPEQYADGKTSTLSDQFSFCVAAWEALYGARPFGTGPLGTVMKRAASGLFVHLPARRGAARRLQRVLQRGLSARPRDRWPSVQAIRAELERRDVRPRWVVIGLGALAIAATSATVASLSGDDACDRFAADDAWNERASATLVPALAEATTPASAQRVDWALSEYSDRWSTAWDGACRAQARTDAPEAFARIEACLLDRRGALTALTDALVEAPDVGAARAFEAVLRLPPPEACVDPEARGDDVDPPAPAIATKVAQLEADLERARALERLERTDDGLELLARLESRARTLAYKPSIAEILRIRGMLLSLAQNPDAPAVLRSAYEVAVEAGSDKTAARAASRLVESLGYDHAQPQAGRTWAVVARAHLRRAGLPPDVGLSVEHGVAATYLLEGKIALAVDGFERTLKLARRDLPADDPFVRRARANLASTYLRAGRNAEARAELSQLLEEQAGELGEDDARLVPLVGQLGVALIRTGDREAGRRYLERAVAVADAAFGADDIKLVVPLSNLGSALADEGRLEESRAPYARVLRLVDRHYPPGHPRRSVIHVNAGEIQEQIGDLAGAAEHYAEALHGCDDAAAPPRCASPFVATGRLALLRSDAAAAVAPLERAAILRAAGGGDPIARAEVQFHLGRARHAIGRDPDTAFRTALQAAEQIEAAGEAWAGLQMQVAPFLAAARRSGGDGPLQPTQAADRD